MADDPSSSLVSPATDMQDQSNIFLFRPESGSAVHSTQITDLITAPDGAILVATNFGLSTFNGQWKTQHINRDNISAGLMDDWITSIEYDSAGNLWIGYGNGIQIFNGKYYTAIRDQEILKSLRVKDIQRWDDDLWVATGNAGLHRYRDGCWTWYQPLARNGPGFYEANSMALDSGSDTLFVATDREGLWQVIPSNDTVSFTKIQDKLDTFGLLDQVRRDPFGGVYFFNATAVAHYIPDNGFSFVVLSSDLSSDHPAINDISAGSNGNLYIATDDGIFVFENGTVDRHLGMFEGFGTSHVIKTVHADALNRIWFSSSDDVGYYTGDVSAQLLIPIEMVTPDTTTSVTPEPSLAVMSPLVSVANGTASTPSLSPIDQFINALYRLFSFLPIPR